MAKLSTRRYRAGPGTGRRRDRGDGEVDVDVRRCPAGSWRATERALDELMRADLSTLDLVALMVDGVHFAEHCCVVALGIAIDGTKHPLGLVEGTTENAHRRHRPARRACATGVWT